MLSGERTSVLRVTSHRERKKVELQGECNLRCGRESCTSMLHTWMIQAATRCLTDRRATSAASCRMLSRRHHNETFAHALARGARIVHMLGIFRSLLHNLTMQLTAIPSWVVLLELVRVIG